MAHGGDLLAAHGPRLEPVRDRAEPLASATLQEVADRVGPALESMMFGAAQQGQAKPRLKTSGERRAWRLGCRPPVPPADAIR